LHPETLESQLVSCRAYYSSGESSRRP